MADSPYFRFGKTIQSSSTDSCADEGWALLHASACCRDASWSSIHPQLCAQDNCIDPDYAALHPDECSTGTTLTVNIPADVRARPDLPFDLMLSATGVIGAATWSLDSTSAALPSSLSIASSSISGHPLVSEIGTWTGVVLSVRDEAGDVGTSNPFSIIVAPWPSVSVASKTIKTGENASIEPVISNVYGSQTWVVSGLMPAGLSLDTSTGIISGIPEQSGTYPLVLSVTDADGATGEASFTLTITSSISISNIKASYHFRVGSAPSVAPVVNGSIGSVKWSLASTSAPLPDGLTLDENTGRIEGASLYTGVTSGVVLEALDTSTGSREASSAFALYSSDGIVISYSDVISRVDESVTIGPKVIDLLGTGYYQIASGIVPSWLDFSPVSGVLTGTPIRTAKISNLSVLVIDTSDGRSAESDTFDISIYPWLYVAAVGKKVIYEDEVASISPPNVSGAIGSLSWFLSGRLPSGLSFDRSTGIISGTPTLEDYSDNLQYIVQDGYDGTTQTSNNFVIETGPRPSYAIYDKNTIGVMNKVFYLAPRVTGSKGTLSFYLSNVSNLPSGLKFNSTTGVISGVATEEYLPETFEISVTDATAVSITSDPFTLAIRKSDFLLSYKEEYDVQAGNLLKAAPNVSGALGTVSYEIHGDLPAWASFDVVTGVISGTPSEAEVGKTERLYVTASDESGVTISSGGFYIVVALPPVLTISASDIQATAGAAFAWTPTVDGVVGTATYALTSGVLPSWASFDGKTGKISGTPWIDDGGVTSGLTIGVADGSGSTATTEDFSLTVVVRDLLMNFSSLIAAPEVSFYFVPPVSGAIGTKTFVLSGSPLPSWARYESLTGTISGTPKDTDLGTTSGIVLSVTDEAGRTATSTFSLTVGTRDLVASYVPSTETVVGKSYEAELVAAGSLGSVAWTLVSGNLPAGLRISGSKVTGVPASVGTSSGLIFSVTDASGRTAQTSPVSITVKRDVLEITGSGDVVLAVNLSASVPSLNILHNVSTVTWSVTSGVLPDGLSLNSESGVISGTPTTIGKNSNIVLSAKDSYDNETASSDPFSIEILGQPTVSYMGGPYKTGSVVYLRPATSNIISGHWSITSGNIPSGLTFDSSTGVFYGIPDTIEESQINVSVIDSFGRKADSGYFTVSVIDGLAFSSVLSGTFDLATSVQWTSPIVPEVQGLASTSGTIKYSTSSSLPPGLLIDSSTGIISGIPTTSGTWATSIVATDDAGATAVGGNIVFVVAGPISISYSGPVDTRVGATNLYVLPTTSGDIASGQWSATGLPLGLVIEGSSGIIHVAQLSSIHDNVGNHTANVIFVDRWGREVQTEITFIIETGLTIGYMPSSYDGRSGQYLSIPAAIVSNNRGAVIFSDPDKTLPTGLSLSVETGAISGTVDPRIWGTFKARIVATDSYDGSIGSTIFILTMAHPLEASTSNAYSHIGQTFTTKAPSVVGQRGALTWSTIAGTFPDGAILDTSTGILSGMGVSTGVWSGIVLSVVDSTDGVGAVTNAFTITIEDFLSVSGLATHYSARLGMPFVMAAPVALHAIGAVTWQLGGLPLPSWASFDQATGVISGTPDETGLSSDLLMSVSDGTGAVANSAPFDLNVYVKPSVDVSDTSMKLRVGDTLSIVPSAAGVNGVPTWSYTVLSGALPQGVTFDASTGEISGVVTAAGSLALTLTVTDSDGISGTSSQINIVVSDVLLVSVDNVYSTHPMKYFTTSSLNIEGNVGSWSVKISGAPDGLSLDGSDGRLYGVITGSPGVYDLVWTITDQFDGRSATTTASLTVLDPITIGQISNIVSSPGSSVDVTPSATHAVGNPTWSLALGALPNGLVLDTSTGRIYGVPTTGSLNIVALKATDSDGTFDISNQFNIDVASAVIVSVVSAPTSNVTVNQSVTGTYSVSGGDGSYYWVVNNTNGSSIIIDGQNTSTVTVSADTSKVGTTAYTVTARDAVGRSATTSKQNIVVSSEKVISGIASIYGSTGIDISGTSFTPTVANSVGTVTWSLASGSLPSGVTVNSTSGKLEGAPTQTGEFTVALKVTDSLSSVSSSQFVIDVTGAVAISGSIPSYVDVNSSATYQLSASGGNSNYSWSMTNTIGSSTMDQTGLVTLDTSSARSLSFAITLKDSVGRAVTKNYSPKVINPIVLNTPTVPSWLLKGTSQQVQFVASGAVGQYTWSISNVYGSSTIDQTGLVDLDSGNSSSSPVTKKFTVTVTDISGKSLSSTITYLVVAPLSATFAVDPSTYVSSGLNYNSSKITDVMSITGGSGNYLSTITNTTGTTTFNSSALTSTWGGPTLYIDTTVGQTITFSISVADTTYPSLTATYGPYSIAVTRASGSQTFTVSGTFTVPSGVTSISVVAVGGGGGGGGTGSSTTSGYGQGGGGGALAYNNNIAVNPGDVLTVTVGAAGARNSVKYSYYAYSGGDSSIVKGTDTLVLAKGGGGSSQYGGAAGACTTQTGSAATQVCYAGGSGGGGGNTYGGGGGGGAGGYYNIGGYGGGGASSGGGGGGGGTGDRASGGAGGGVSLAGCTSTSTCGWAGTESGSGGSKGSYSAGGRGGHGGIAGDGSATYGSLSLYGGGGQGGGASNGYSTYGTGGTQGAVRILWGGNSNGDYSFPLNAN